MVLRERQVMRRDGLKWSKVDLPFRHSGNCRAAIFLENIRKPKMIEPWATPNSSRRGSKSWQAQPNETDSIFKARLGLCRVTRFHQGGSGRRHSHLCVWGAAELGRLDCRKDFDYGREWNGKFYSTKQVRPVFVEESAIIVVITVYIRIIFEP
jgi:hypothetical protein